MWCFARHGTLGSYLRGALYFHEDSADAGAPCLLIPRVKPVGGGRSMIVVVLLVVFHCFFVLGIEFHIWNVILLLN
jgi:hypothetical protein